MGGRYGEPTTCVCTFEESSHPTVEQRLVRAEELNTLVEKALDGSGESFRLKFDDGSDLYLSTSGGILTATVSS